MSEAIANAFYSYRPKNNWCKHGILFTTEHKGAVWASDTYWTGGAAIDWERATLFGNIQVDPAYPEIKFLFMADEMEPLQYPERTRTWYESSDILWIPIGGGSERTYVRKSAKPVPSRVVAWFQQQIKEEEANIRSAIWQIQRHAKEMKEWEDKLCASERAA